MKSFASDNYSAVMPEIFDYLAGVVNQDHAPSYGHDKFTKKASDVVKTSLGLPSAEVHFLPTGTGANVLSLKQSLRSTQSALVPTTSHLYANETGAPEVMAGVKLIGINSLDGKIDLDHAQTVLDQERDLIPHAPRPRLLSVAQSTEYGTVYSPNEMRLVAEFCHKNTLLLHLDLCRVYNASVHLNLNIADIITAFGPDILSLGGTKDGLMMAEAVVIINDDLKSDFELLQKQGLQLYSKMRYLAGQFIPFFEEGLWKKAATQANAMTQLLVDRLEKISAIKITRPVQTNHIFAILPREITPLLQEKFPFYVWDIATNEVRFVTSWDTTEAEVNEFADLIQKLVY